MELLQSDLDGQPPADHGYDLECSILLVSNSFTLELLIIRGRVYPAPLAELKKALEEGISISLFQKIKWKAWYECKIWRGINSKIFVWEISKSRIKSIWDEVGEVFSYGIGVNYERHVVGSIESVGSG